MRGATHVMHRQPLSAELTKQLRLSSLAHTVAPILYAAKATHYGEHPDYLCIWEQAPPHIRHQCIREAEEAVLGADEFHRREAERRAMLAFLESYDSAERLAYALDEDHSKAYLIEAAILTLRRLLLLEKPWAALISTYRHALRGRA